MLLKWVKSRSPETLVLLTNTLEFFDLYLYIHFGWLIQKIFFQDWSADFLESFRLGNIYLIAPISCVVFALIGDLKGRNIVILSSSALMGLASLAIIALPVEWYPLECAYLLILIRIIQGIALGGEPMAAYLYLMESGKNIRKLTFYNYIVAVTEGIGGILALAIGSAVLFFFGEEHWRIIFIFVALFISFVFIIRYHLTNSREYNECLMDQKISLMDTEDIIEVFKFRNYMIRWNNYVAGFLIWLAYPSMFVVCYLYITPFICTKMAWGQQALIWYNLALTFVQHALTLALFWFVTHRTSLNLRITGLVSFGMGISIISLCLLNLDHLPVAVIFMSQVALMSLVNYGWITPDIFKTFSVIGRYTTMARTWACAKFINFFICIFVLKAAISAYGLGHGSLLVLLVINCIAVIAFFIMKPYSSMVRQDDDISLFRQRY